MPRQWGPTVLMQGLQLQRPQDVLRARSLSVDDKRAILAAFYAVDSKPAFRQLPRTPGPVTIDEVQSARADLDKRYDL